MDGSVRAEHLHPAACVPIEADDRRSLRPTRGRFRESESVVLAGAGT